MVRGTEDKEKQRRVHSNHACGGVHTRTTRIVGCRLIFIRFHPCDWLDASLFSWGHFGHPAQQQVGLSLRFPAILWRCFVNCLGLAKGLGSFAEMNQKATPPAEAVHAKRSEITVKTLNRLQAHRETRKTSFLEEKKKTKQNAKHKRTKPLKSKLKEQGRAQA